MYCKKLLKAAFRIYVFVFSKPRLSAVFQQEERMQQVENLIPNERLVRNSLVKKSSL